MIQGCQPFGSPEPGELAENGTTFSANALLTSRSLGTRVWQPANATTSAATASKHDKQRRLRDGIGGEAGQLISESVAHGAVNRPRAKHGGISSQASAQQSRVGPRHGEGKKRKAQTKTPRPRPGRSMLASLTMSYFHGKYIPLSSALRRFTVLFGMGRSGTTSLWSSGKEGRPVDSRGAAIKRSNLEEASAQFSAGCAIQTSISRTRQHGYRIKPHEQLVPVSLTPHSASTPGLSTSWSRTTLQGDQVPGKTNLQASFPLRCFQRLSLPHIATRQCHWRDNRYTRGASTPVLSY